MGHSRSARGRRLSGLSSAVAWVLWSCSLLRVTIAGNDAEEGDKSPAAAPTITESPDHANDSNTAAPQTDERRAPEQLSISIGKDNSFPFAGLPGPVAKGPTDEVLLEAGEVKPRFQCEGDASLLALEEDNIADRRLLLWTSANKGILDQLGFGGDQPDLGLELTDARIRGEDIPSGDPDLDSVGVTLRIELEELITDSSRLEVGSDYDHAAPLKVKYDCRREGRALVFLQLQVADKNGATSDVCLRWVKACSVGWKDLEIKQVQPGVSSSSPVKVFSAGEVDADWNKRMSVEGTQKGTTQLQLSSPGVLRLRRPQIESDQKLVTVELLGPLIYADTSEVSSDPVSLTVTYTCNFDGFSDVTLILEKDTLLADEEPEIQKLRWRKHCGVTVYKHLQVFIRSESLKNRTQAVVGGAVKSGFKRPCIGLNAHAQVISDCSQKLPIHVVSEKETRTSLDLEVDSEGLMEMPTFDPAPDFTYNGKVLRITVTQSPPAPGLPGKQRHTYKRKQVLSVKYTCFKEGTSTVTATLHVREHRAIYLAWQKKCAEPKIHTSKALTAPQAIIVTMFVCGIIGLVACMVFIVSSQGEEKASSTGKAKYNRVNNGYEGDIELPSKLDAEVIGNEPKPGEVVYH